MIIGLTYDLRSDYLAQGYSLEETAEFDSEETIAGIEGALRSLGFETDRIGRAQELVHRIERGDRWDLVFNICEGLRGTAREAQVPSILDLYEIPYVFSSPLTLALTLHKGMAKRVVRDSGIPTSDFLVVECESDLSKINFPPPYFVKPAAEGTGKGCSGKSIVRDFESLSGVCREIIQKFREPALVEHYLSGREFTVGIIGSGEKASVLGTMEILLSSRAEQGVYSFLNKDNYEGRVSYEFRPSGSSPLIEQVEKVALDAWRVLDCCDGGRVDIRCSAEGQPMFLEVNTLAGLRPRHSDICILAGMAGITYEDLIARIMEAAISRLSAEGKLSPGLCFPNQRKAACG